MENPIKIDDLGVHLFLETPISKKFPTGPIERTPKKPENLIALATYTERGPLGRSHSIFDGI